LIYRWHDAGTYDAKTRTGGPNGSIRNQQELNHAANKGLKTAVELCGQWDGGDLNLFN
jgi:L-ascorbate peroxidase